MPFKERRHPADGHCINDNYTERERRKKTLSFKIYNDKK
jgi:hypothetical protein